MKSLRVALPLLLLTIAGCHQQPCETSSECGASEVCASQRCQALSCDSTYFATDPADGTCRPLPACGNRDDVRGWASCDNPCGALHEHACIADPRCQPAYVTDGSIPCAGPVPEAGIGSASLKTADDLACSNSSARTFVACRPNPLRVDPCAGKSEVDCRADSRCVGEIVPLPQAPCDCPADAPCSCGGTGQGVSPFECRVSGCSDIRSIAECNAHSECESGGGVNSGQASSGGRPSPPPPSASTGLDDGFFGCFPKGFGSCRNMDERTCLAHSECHPVGESCYCPANATCACGGGKFLFCEPDDGLARCDNDTECGGNQRCSNDEVCAPPIGGSSFAGEGGVSSAGGGSSSGGTPLPLDVPLGLGCAGLCVPKGCAGYGEARCNADPTCTASYQLHCSPYGGGGVAAFAPCGGPNGGPTAGDSAGAAVPACGGCEPSFVGCKDSPRGSVVDPSKSVLITLPQVVDAPVFAFANVLGKLAGGDPARLATNLFAQITTDQTVAGRKAMARQGATQFVAQLPRRGDGLIDPAQLGFQVTSLSNRLDLAGPKDCGEARITYSLKAGVTDRRHRMTVIVELHQPDDGVQCASVARQWVALSQLSGDALAAAATAIYAPLLTPTNLSQVRTNEFLVGQPAVNDPSAINEPWELREWHLGTDGLLHLALSKQAIDPTLTKADDFTTWAKQNSAALIAGTVTVPDNFLAVTSSENGQRVVFSTGSVDDFQVETAINKLACAGCHTTEFNTAFTHVAERFNGTGAARISDFLNKQLPGRSIRLWKAAQGGLLESERAAIKSIH